MEAICSETDSPHPRLGGWRLTFPFFTTATRAIVFGGKTQTARPSALNAGCDRWTAFYKADGSANMPG
jgi:hypothetical protein